MTSSCLRAPCKNTKCSVHNIQWAWPATAHVKGAPDVTSQLRSRPPLDSLWLVTPLASRLVCIAKWPDWLAWLAWMARRLAAFICSLIGAKASPALKTNNGAHYSAQMYDQKSCGSHEYGQRQCRAVATVATLDYGYVASCCLLPVISGCVAQISGQDVWLEADGCTHIKSSTHAQTMLGHKIQSKR